MLLQGSLLPFVVAAAASAVPSTPIPPRAEAAKKPNIHFGLDTFTKLTPSTSIVWTPCLNLYECAMLDVPLDYYNQAEGAPRAYVPLMKLPATDQKNYKGMVLVNPGGPGASGIEVVNNFGALWSNASETVGAIGPNYDIIGWEPRGVGFSIPSANCTNNTAPSVKLSKRFDLPDGPMLRYDDIQSQDIDESKSSNAAKCHAEIGGPEGAGQHMSTATVVRDMATISDAFAATADGKRVKNPKLTNYFGISYGTSIGQAFASMFPGRVGRIMLWGIVDPDENTTGLPMRNLQSADEEFATFFVYCSMAGMNKCAYAMGDNPGDIYLRFEKTLARLDYDTALDRNWNNATLIRSMVQLLKQTIAAAHYSPRATMPKIAQGLLALEAGVAKGLTREVVANITESFVGEQDEGVPSEYNASEDWLSGNMCADQNGAMTNMTVDEIWPLMNVLEHTSYIGGDTMFGNWAACLGWTIPTKEVYQGPFGGPTANPILFIGNSWDHVTPIYNALKAGNVFTNSEVLTVNEPGHAQTNVCAVKKQRAFMQHGTMPGNDNFCIGTEPGSGVFGTTLTIRMEDNGAWRSIVGRMRGLRMKSWKPLP